MRSNLTTIAEALKTVRYVTDTQGEKTDVLVPLATWQALLALWEAMVEKLEEQEDLAIVQECLEKRTRGEVEMISLDALEEELLADGLLSR